MGRITVKEAEDLRQSGTLTDDTIKDLQDRGIISNRTRATKRYMCTQKKTKVYPTMYFRGLGKKETPTKDMLALRTEWTNIVTKYTKEENDNA